MRFLCFLLLFLLTILEVGPIPITGILLMWVVLFRPPWFYRLVQAVYKGAIPDEEAPEAETAEELEPQTDGAGAQLD